jgi:sugar phosphate isomerase/epimerase
VVGRVYVSTACLAGGDDVLQTLDVYAQANLRNIELGATHSYRDGLEAQLLKKHDLNLILHSYFPPPCERIAVNLASQDAAILERSRKQINRSIDFCQVLGTDFFSFHSGFRVEPDEHYRFKANGSAAPYETAFATLVESVKEINSHAEAKGIRVAIENHGMPEEDLSRGENLTYLLCEAWEFERLWEAVLSDNVGMLLDLGHLKLASQSLGFDREEFMDRVKEKVFSIHVHDNNGRADEHREINEESWCLQVLRDRWFPGAKIVTESRGLTIDQILEQVRLLENSVGQ